MRQSSWIGRTIGGRYQITELLGQGGMSAVYKASDPNLRRVVAIKLIHSHLSSEPQFVHRFKDEAAAVASLRHPNIVQVYDFNNDDDVYFIVFEFVPGESLQQYQTRVVNAGRVIPLAQTIEQGSNVADALAYAHGKGIIHRDIKPANVMLNAQNQAVLMDFGLVKLTGSTSHTAEGAVMGTARYMSPEQIRGERVDMRTDIYSLGVMLYEMAAGRPPFEADSALSLMMMHVNEPVPSLLKIRSDVPASFAQVIEKALVKDREKRYQTAGEFASALRAIDRNSGALVTGAAATGAVTASAAVAKQSAASQPAPVPSQSAQNAAYAASTATSPQPPIYPPGSQDQPASSPSSGGTSSKRSIGIVAGIAVVLMLFLCIGGAAAVFGTGLLSGDDGNQDTEQEGAVVIEETQADEPTKDDAITTEATEIPAVATKLVTTETAANSAEPTLEPTATSTEEPATAATEEPTTAATEEPTAAATDEPTPTTPAGPNVTINGIGVANGQYEVEYTTSGYTPSLPGGEHIHFFFDTVRPEDAGLPGPGPWLIYAGPVPFALYSVGSRPAGANTMCALVANVDHSVQLGTGNCFVLP